MSAGGVNGRQGQSQDDGPGSAPTPAARQTSCEDRPPPLMMMQPRKEHTKFVRILTVIGYVICVSSGAIMLSLYYMFLWDPYRQSPTPDDMPQTANVSTCLAYIQHAQRLKHEAAAGAIAPSTSAILT